MKIEQIYTSCLAQGAYYIESNGEVAIIDPLREVQGYINKATDDNAKIKYIFETHFHADFVSGHVTLAEKTGAKIVFGPLANPNYVFYQAVDNEVFEVGDITITALHTPGHTMESTCYLLKDKNKKNCALFSGDTLFLGDVGRPDLAQKLNEFTQNDLAGFLFDSLRNKIMILEDDVVVYPAHGAGSACGKNLSSETVGTLGEQKQSNYALRANMTKDEFINEVTDGLLPPPNYFPVNVKLNKEGYGDVAQLVQNSKSLDVVAFNAAVKQHKALILDVRHQDDFCKSHIPNSLFVGIDGGFAPWVGALVSNYKQPIAIVCAAGREAETVTRLARVGFDNVIGYLENGFESWLDANLEIKSINGITSAAVQAVYDTNALIFDVRKPGEYQSDHIENAISAPLDFIYNHLNDFPKNKPFYIHCAGGYRSVIAASILKANGFDNVIDIKGGFQAIKTTTIKRTQSACTLVK